MDLNNRISALRKEHNMSQEAVAEALGVSRQAVSKWETGQSYPDTENLIKLAELFGVTADALIKPDVTAPDEVSNKGRRGMWIAVIAAVVMLLAVVFVFLKYGVVDLSELYDITTTPSPTAIATSIPSAEPQSSSGPLAGAPAQDDTARDVYLAFITVTGENVTASEKYEGRLTIYQGLRGMDWAVYEAFGEAGKNTGTRMALLNWLAAQETLSEDELSGLLAGMNNRGIDGAYSEPYAQALSNALIAYPVQFIQGLSDLEDATYARDVGNMAVYGASYTRLDAAVAALESAIRSGTLSDAEYQWAISLKDRCAWYSGGDNGE